MINTECQSSALLKARTLEVKLLSAAAAKAAWSRRGACVDRAWSGREGGMEWAWRRCGVGVEWA